MRRTPFTGNSVRLAMGFLRRPETAYLAVLILAIVKAVAR